MERKELIKILRRMIRNLSDETLFLDSDFNVSDTIDGVVFVSRVQDYVTKNLKNYVIQESFYSGNI